MAEVAEKSSQAAASRTEGGAISTAYCECGEGWSCEITKTDGADAGKTFFKCGNGCKCEVGLPPTCEIVQGSTPGEVICKCGEGWTCVITKTKGPDAQKPFAECSGDACKCSARV